MTLLYIFSVVITVFVHSMLAAATEVEVPLINNAYTYTAILNATSIRNNDTNHTGTFLPMVAMIAAVMDTNSHTFNILTTPFNTTVYTDDDKVTSLNCPDGSVEAPSWIKDMSTVSYWSAVYDTAYNIGFLNISMDSSSSSTTSSTGGGGFLAEVSNCTYISSCEFGAENLYLHNWTLDNHFAMDSGDSGSLQQMVVPSNAHMGLAYCSELTNSEHCLFENLLKSVNDNLKFGLDLNMNVSYATAQAVASVSGGASAAAPILTLTPTPSTLQLGYFHSEYAPYLVFQRPSQPVESLSDFTMMTQNFQLLCNTAIGSSTTAPTGISILSNFSIATYPMVIDSGAVGLTLPEQFYDNLISWIDTDVDSTTTVDDFLAQLPVLRFQLSQNSSDLNNFYIPLANLLISRVAFAAQVNTNGVVTPPSYSLFNPACDCQEEYSLAIIRGPSIYSQTKDNFAVPSIVLGTLALQGIYFAADMENGVLGLANKYQVSSDQSTSAADISPYAPFFTVGAMNSLLTNGGKCAAETYCGSGSSSSDGYGDSTSMLQMLSNTCSAPECSEYFFTTRRSPHSTDCVVDAGYYNVGIILLSLFVAMDILSYFSSQYSGISRCRTPLGIDETRSYYNVRNAYVSYLLRARHFVSSRIEKVVINGIGKLCSLIIDALLVHVFGWVPASALYAEGGARPNRVPGMQR